MKNQIILFSTVFLLLVTITVIILVYFNAITNTELSTLDDWSKFSDFFGGIINTIISFFSLIILAIITVVVSNQSNAENKRINLLLKRIDSYDKLANYFPKLILCSQEFKNSSTIINIKLQENKDFDFRNELTDFTECCKVITETFSFIVSFGMMYGHLYKFNFNSLEYNNLIITSQKVNENFNTAREELTLKRFNFKDLDLNHMNDLVMQLDKILKQLKTELK